MKLVLLGSGGYYPTNCRHTACFMLPELGVVLDAGTGMCRLGDYLTTDRLDIFLTHVHLDHVVGLTYLLNVAPAEVLSQTTVHGEAEKLAALREHLFAREIFPVDPPFQFETLRQSWPLPSGGTLDHFPLEHPGGSLGFRLNWPGQSMAYVTDTTAAAEADYVERIHGVDLLIHECFFANDQGNMPAITGHSWLRPVAEVAAAAQVGRLVLVHVNPTADTDRDFDLAAARRIFPNTEIGVDCAEMVF
jgi:ribonuclease BN (tRNA processing enzyme)